MTTKHFVHQNFMIMYCKWIAALVLTAGMTASAQTTDKKQREEEVKKKKDKKQPLLLMVTGLLSMERI